MHTLSLWGTRITWQAWSAQDIIYNTLDAKSPLGHCLHGGKTILSRATLPWVRLYIRWDNFAWSLRVSQLCVDHIALHHRSALSGCRIALIDHHGHFVHLYHAHRQNSRHTSAWEWWHRREPRERFKYHFCLHSCIGVLDVCLSCGPTRGWFARASCLAWRNLWWFTIQCVNRYYLCQRFLMPVLHALLDKEPLPRRTPQK